MILDIQNEVVSSTLEKVDIHFEFDPSNEEEEGLASIVGSIVDLVGKYTHAIKIINETEETPVLEQSGPKEEPKG